MRRKENVYEGRPVRNSDISSPQRAQRQNVTGSESHRPKIPWTYVPDRLSLWATHRSVGRGPRGPHSVQSPLRPFKSGWIGRSKAESEDQQGQAAARRASTTLGSRAGRSQNKG